MHIRMSSFYLQVYDIKMFTNCHNSKDYWIFSSSIIIVRILLPCRNPSKHSSLKAWRASFSTIILCYVKTSVVIKASEICCLKASLSTILFITFREGYGSFIRIPRISHGDETKFNLSFQHRIGGIAVIDAVTGVPVIK